MVNVILERIIQAFQEPRNQEKIQTQCIDPLLKYLLNRMFPYIILICIIFSIILLMSFTSVGLLMIQLYAGSKADIMAMALPMAAPMPMAMASPMPMAMASPMPIPMASPMASPMPMAMPMAAPMPMPMASPIAALAESAINHLS